MKRLLEERLRVYEGQFWKSPEAQRYWVERGLTSETAKAFHVGFVGDPLRGDGRFQGRLAIPYLAIGGVVSFKFRAIDGSEERFSKDKGDPNRLFNTRVLKRAVRVVITEGEFDCMAATQAGLDAIGIPGANNWKASWTRVFYHRDVVILADGDEAGHEFGELVAQNIYGAKIVDMPQGEDVNSMLMKSGEQYIRDAVLK